jgi:hypothetical protein
MIAAKTALGCIESESEVTEMILAAAVSLTATTGQLLLVDAGGRPGADRCL